MVINQYIQIWDQKNNEWHRVQLTSGFGVHVHRIYVDSLVFHLFPFLIRRRNGRPERTYSLFRVIEFPRGFHKVINCQCPGFRLNSVLLDSIGLNLVVWDLNIRLNLGLIRLEFKISLYRNFTSWTQMIFPFQPRLYLFHWNRVRRWVDFIVYRKRILVLIVHRGDLFEKWVDFAVRVYHRPSALAERSSNSKNSSSSNINSSNSVNSVNSSNNSNTSSNNSNSGSYCSSGPALWINRSLNLDGPTCSIIHFDFTPIDPSRTEHKKIICIFLGMFVSPLIFLFVIASNIPST